MMVKQAPHYMNENRYSYYSGIWAEYNVADYEVESPEGSYEINAMNSFMKGEKHLQDEEYVIALKIFRELQAWIYGDVVLGGSKCPMPPSILMEENVSRDPALFDIFAAKSAHVLKNTPLLKCKSSLKKMDDT